MQRIPFRKFVKFCIVGGIGAALQWSIMSIFIEILNLHWMIGFAVAITVVTVWNFTGNLKWTFK